MPEPARPPRRRAPSPRRFAAGALASFVAVFGVLALRVHDGDDPALASSAKATTSAATTTSVATTTSSATDDSSGAAASSSDDSSSGAVTSTPGASTSAS